MSFLLVSITVFSVVIPAYSSKEIRFGLVTGEQNMINNGALSGINAALEDINERSDVLFGYTLKYELHSKVGLSYCEHQCR